ncbi:fumarylacetoacetate hydrolase family protein, partial [Xanthomonas citri pv. citri]
MKLLSFIAGGRASFGAIKDDGVVDLGTRMAPCTTLRQLLESGRVAEAARLVASTAPDHPLDKIAFAPVIPDPGKIICVGLNYRDHVAETGRTVTEKPALFVRFPCSQVGHLQPIVKPKVSDDFDYEG